MEINYAKEVGEHLLSLPECSKKVLVVSPEYGNSNYTCDVIADSHKLATWAKKHASGVYGGNDQGARLALPFWLANANNDDDSITKISSQFNSVLEPYTLDFLELGIAHIFCHECQAIDEHPELKHLDDEDTDPWNISWVQDWKCSKGHLLHHSDHHIHVCY